MELDMKKNMGSVDKAVRIVAALAVLVLILAGQITGSAAIILGILAVVFVATSLISFCPLYTLFNIKTCKVQEKK
jgi:hypothetical protein